MLDGINYYPKKKKRIKRKLFLFLLFLLVLGAIWYYFQDIEIGGSQSSSIIISLPSVLEESEDIAVENIEQSISPSILENKSESLDEVINTYEANTQN